MSRDAVPGTGAQDIVACYRAVVAEAADMSVPVAAIRALQTLGR